MGTRAQFFIGNPQDLTGRLWLGCVAYDGYPEGDLGDAFGNVESEAEFMAAIENTVAGRNDYCDPGKHGFPFPWREDLFLTDYTYAWFDGALQFTFFHQGWIKLADYLASEDEREAYHQRGNALPGGVPAPGDYDRTAPDSIIVVSA